MIPKSPKGRIVTTLSFILFGSSCGTFANYIVPQLKDRPLRVDIETPRTVFRWYKSVPCGAFGVFRCREEVLEYDFDLSAREDRVRFNQLGFECSVPVRP